MEDWEGEGVDKNTNYSTGEEGTSHHITPHRVAYEELENLVQQRSEALLISYGELQKESLEHQRVEQELRSLAHKLVVLQEEERRKVSRELHDVLGQTLTMLKLMVIQAQKSSPEKSHSILKQMEDIVMEAVTQVRQLSYSLRPGILDDLGLLAALQWCLNDFSKRTGISVDFKHAGLEQQFPIEVSTAAFRIVQEALTNVARYAGVKEVKIEAEAVDGKLKVQVSDRGVGFNPAQVAATCGGIRGMRERAYLVGGDVSVSSSPSAGTVVSIDLPLGPDKKQAGEVAS